MKKIQLMILMTFMFICALFGGSVRASDVLGTQLQGDGFYFDLNSVVGSVGTPAGEEVVCMAIYEDAGDNDDGSHHETTGYGCGEMKRQQLLINITVEEGEPFFVVIFEDWSDDTGMVMHHVMDWFIKEDGKVGMDIHVKENTQKLALAKYQEAVDARMAKYIEETGKDFDQLEKEAREAFN